MSTYINVLTFFKKLLVLGLWGSTKMNLQYACIVNIFTNCTVAETYITICIVYTSLTVGFIYSIAMHVVNVVNVGGYTYTLSTQYNILYLHSPSKSKI